MTAIWQYPIFQTLGWTLIHSLWQGTLVWGLAAVLLRLLRNKSPQARYAAACGAIGAMFLLIFATYAYLANQIAPVIPNSVETAATAVATAATRPMAVASGGTWLARTVPWLSIGWMIGVMALSIRLLGGWYWLFHDIKRGAAPAPSEWQWRVAGISRSLGVKRVVRLLVSHRVSTPMAVGWIKPAVLLPAAALLRLTPEALEAILAHELAHIRRHDFAVNLLQSIVEALFFYHPATWWLSGQIRELREHCCDDAAVKHCGSAVSYAGALTTLETLRAGSAPPQLAPAANGATLMKRIQRLLNVPEPAASGLRAGFIATVVISVMGASALWGFNDSQKKLERQRISIRDGNTSLSVQMRGDVKLDANSKDGVTLGDGASIEIASKEKETTRRFAVSRKGDEVKKTYRVNGQEKPLDAEAEEWVKNQIQEAKAVETRKLYLIANSNDKISFEITEDGAEGKGSRVIAYSNKSPAVVLISPQFDGSNKTWSFDGGAWNGYFTGDGWFGTEEGRKRLEGLRAAPPINIEELKKAVEGLQKSLGNEEWKVWLEELQKSLGDNEGWEKWGEGLHKFFNSEEWEKLLEESRAKSLANSEEQKKRAEELRERAKELRKQAGEFSKRHSELE